LRKFILEYHLLGKKKIKNNPTNHKHFFKLAEQTANYCTVVGYNKVVTIPISYKSLVKGSKLSKLRPSAQKKQTSTHARNSFTWMHSEFQNCLCHNFYLLFSDNECTIITKDIYNLLYYPSLRDKT